MNALLDYSYTKHALGQTPALDNALRKRIFILSYSWTRNHYYYLVDLEEYTTKRWKVSYENDYRQIVSEIEKSKNYEHIEDVLDPFNFSFVPHSSIMYEDKIYVFLVNALYFTVIDLKHNSISQVYDDQRKMISSTNFIIDNQLYYARYKIEDRIDNIRSNSSIPTELVKMDLTTKSTEVISNFESNNIVHSVAVNRDKQWAVVISTTANPIVTFEEGKKNYTQDELKTMLDKGLHNSQLHVFDLTGKVYHQILLANSPAHVESDMYDDNIFYISSHSLGVNPYDGFVYCFGEGAINKLILKDTPQIIQSYAADDFSRLSSHKMFSEGNKQYIAVTVFPQQIHILDSDSMSVVSKIKLSKDAYTATLKNGAYKYPRVDKTPFSVHPVSDTPYLFLITGRGIVLYDRQRKEAIQSIIYNQTKDPIAVLGHSVVQ